MGKSIFDGAGSEAGRLIYGIQNQIPCCVDDLCLTQDLLDNFKMVLTQVEQTVRELFPNIETKAPFYAKMGMTAFLGYPWCVRLIWRSRNEGIIWTGSDDQILQLLDIYLANGWPWTGDKLFDENATCLPENLFPQPADGLPTITRGVGGTDVSGETVAADPITKV